jgi:molecular chaperone HscA
MLLQIHEPGQTPDPHSTGVATPKQGLAIGIDLGTTHSVAAIMEVDVGSGNADNTVHNNTINPGNPGNLGTVRVLATDAAARSPSLMPSVVAYGRDGQVAAVGTAALRLLGQGDYTVIRSVKRLMGRGLADIMPIAGQFAWPLLAASDADAANTAMVQLQLAGGRIITPVEVAADILRALKEEVEEGAGMPVTQAVITVPAYFDDAARSATRDAARLAGLEVLRLLNEPTAAALAYGLDDAEAVDDAATESEAKQGTFLVYDLGGGTFDVSLLKLEGGVFRVLATAGDTQYGGDDLDRLILEHWLAAGQVPQPPADLAILTQLLLAAKSVKEQLGKQEMASLSLASGQAAPLNLSLNRATLSQMASDWLQPSLDLVARVLQDGGVTADQLTGIVLVGGSTRLGSLKQLLHDRFACPLFDSVNPDEVVAVGAARQAHALTQGAAHLLLDVTPLSLGLETMGGVVEKLIHRNSPIPCQASIDYTTYQDGQTAMLIHVVQGEWETVEQCRSLARFTLSGIPPMMAGMAKVQVSFALDADGLLTVTARELTTGVVQEVAVKPSYGLSEDSMAEMLMTSMAGARDDMANRLWRDAVVEAGRLLNLLTRSLAEDGDLLDAEEAAAIAAQQQVVERTMGDAAQDRDALLTATATLEQLVTPFAERRVNRAFTRTIGGQTLESAKQVIG